MSDMEYTWGVTYHSGDVDDIKAHAYSDLSGRAEFRDINGDLIAVIWPGVYRSIIRVDALVEPDYEFEGQTEVGRPVSEAEVTLFYPEGGSDTFRLDTDICYHAEVAVDGPVDSAVRRIAVDIVGQGTAHRSPAPSVAAVEG
ncbi:hypothetical protein Rhe02_54490 [Rhizocola hellebori]|uniref:Uncharacterized protein n=1 Tax=Rhizocola hellebori TaxID=1392758 RepID=A0A8J3QCC0_9ACTN|nr:hypothetical protein [Rhizocola hellebori]GIH07382.1 hypothetical protein Rhe02_54490 [Rhizocola hellebori]